MSIIVQRLKESFLSKTFGNSPILAQRNKGIVLPTREPTWLDICCTLLNTLIRIIVTPDFWLYLGAVAWLL